MATIRRLSDDDVRAIFESLHHNRHPPPHLRFQIVPVGANGLKLSPPSFEFEDGLYVLLRPQKKKKNIILEEQPKPPPHLKDYVIPNLPPASCPWSLSGPQFPQPTAIQQRYCYPKGNPAYSSRKGGALWTMYGADGTEDLEFRLLHVYYSAKRAVNRGMKVASGVTSTTTPSPKKRARFQPYSTSTTSAPLCMASPVTASVASSKSFSFDMASPSFKDDVDALSPIFTHRRNASNTNFVTPMSDDIFEKLQQTLSPPRPPQPLFHHQRDHSTVTADTTFPHDGYQQPTPVHNHTRNHVSPPNSSEISRKKTYRPTDESPWDQIEREPPTQAPEIAWDPFPFDMEADLLDFNPSWTDTLPESDIESHESHQEDSISSFASRLEVLHESMKEKIFLANESEQGQLLHILSTWAKKVAQSPLGKVDLSNGEVAEEEPIKSEMV